MIIPNRRVCATQWLFDKYVDVPVCIASGRSPANKNKKTKKDEREIKEKRSRSYVKKMNIWETL